MVLLFYLILLKGDCDDDVDVDVDDDRDDDDGDYNDDDDEGDGDIASTGMMPSTCISSFS